MALTEGKYTGEFLLAEAPGTISRDTVTVRVAASATYPPGTVLGQLTSGGQYVPYDSAESDGREEAVAILYGEVANASLSPANVSAVVINFGAEVRKADLVWETGVDKTAAYAALAAFGIKARD